MTAAAGTQAVPVDGLRPWGLHALIDLYLCPPEVMTDEAAVRRFAGEMVDLIGMEAYGDPIVEFFGCGLWKPGDPEDQKPDTAGFTLVQLIETSAITMTGIVGHFADTIGEIILDVNSCAPYNPEAVLTFAKDFFHAQDATLDVRQRGSLRPALGSRHA